MSAALRAVVGIERLTADLISSANATLGRLDLQLMGKDRVTEGVLQEVDRFNSGDHTHFAPFDRNVLTGATLQLVTVETGPSWRVGLLVRERERTPALFFGNSPFRFPAWKLRDLSTQVRSEQQERFHLVTHLDDPQILVDARIEEGGDYAGTPYVATRSLVVPHSRRSDQVAEVVDPVRGHFYTLPFPPADFLDAHLVVASVTPTDLLEFGSHLVTEETLPGLAAAAMANGYHYVRVEFSEGPVTHSTVSLRDVLHQFYLDRLRGIIAGVREGLIAGGAGLVQFNSDLTGDLLTLGEQLEKGCTIDTLVETILHKYPLRHDWQDVLHQVASLAVYQGLA